MDNNPNWIAMQGFQSLLLWKLLGFKVINMQKAITSDRDDACKYFDD